MKSRKIDRRTLYTINVIKEAFLTLINQKSYSKITVAQVCREAEITRSTFYLHFDNLTDVLNSVLDDAMMISQNSADSTPLTGEITTDYLKQNESLLPTCQRIANSQKYRALLMDPDLSEYIIGRIAKHERAKSIPQIQKRTGLNQKDAETLFSYTIHGSFAINKRHHFVKDDEWYHEVKMLNQFINAGYEYFKKKN
ncbi:TetR/AcrR family transcriptional regulator [Limosilactobacillus fastidiosus]|uniref:TetR/AcrR family transcriptional regulator n=1 Tax=Limosilactobacillus fastidiosus TaxID=2759855 RepID=A0A7W3TYZ2_9LACO|nr:TetR/AcrR family transcriptional regulator [Limosilactobacillus fastidiosus]MBB1063418.1 TetR/AcrR family transcriptional regulator [Limosilactobacillus fastidiosus]MBB1085901.1 TetR/AcrR family transcriptional regulator [Limosilactobacillus fastidiosus]MCD7084686.1 TetR/AcrR family transcriptional regulator [Limosilactobacillus fastidiosus]MCD7085762.1 TetR/AcrR family transcriptional regulator [Limosilactobacillus fastidiosus]MCD7113839.1 TetR/AcrR family transcriptional regulator [Limosi